METTTEKTAIASIKNLSVTPRKTRLVTDLIKGMQVNRALAQLQMMGNRSSDPITKLIKSATANAREKGMNTDNLVISKVIVNQGRMLKRGISKSRGRVGLIQKKFSHVELTLQEGTAKGPKFVIHEKPKVDKTDRVRPEQRQKQEYENIEKQVKREKKGFMQNIFRRKSI